MRALNVRTSACAQIARHVVVGLAKNGIREGWRLYVQVVGYGGALVD